MASSKLKKAAIANDDGLTIDMSPMIDMVFLLLIFFLVASTAVIVKQDPEVKPPVARNSKRAEDGTGRIVINVREDGTLTSESLQTLDDDDAVLAYVKAEKDKVDAQAYQPKLHLRGDKDSVFKHSRRVIRLSAKAGVDQVLFSTFGFEKSS